MAPDEARPFEHVAILGLGLMGGSLARGLRRLAHAPRVVGWSRDGAEGRAAEEQGAVARSISDVGRAVEGADLVIVAVPLEAACDVIRALPGALGPGTLVTDVVSLKVPMRDSAVGAGLAPRFVGSHPMCGSERSGFAASRPDLFEGARVWITPDGASPSAAARVSGFWEALGAHTLQTTPEAHDDLMALASHLPQLTANALAEVLQEAGIPPGDLGPGGLDATRLAMSSPVVWRDLLAHAPAPLPAALKETAQRLATLADLLERRDLDTLEARMSATRTWRSGS